MNPIPGLDHAIEEIRMVRELDMERATEIHEICNQVICLRMRFIEKYGREPNYSILPHKMGATKILGMPVIEGEKLAVGLLEVE